MKTMSSWETFSLMGMGGGCDGAKQCPGHRSKVPFSCLHLFNPFHQGAPVTTMSSSSKNTVRSKSGGWSRAVLCVAAFVWCTRSYFLADI